MSRRNELVEAIDLFMSWPGKTCRPVCMLIYQNYIYIDNICILYILYNTYVLYILYIINIIKYNIYIYVYIIIFYYIYYI